MIYFIYLYIFIKRIYFILLYIYFSFINLYIYIFIYLYFIYLRPWLAACGINSPSESESHSVVSKSLQPHVLYSPWNSPSQDTGVGRLSLLQHIFPTHESNRGLLHCRHILYQLNYNQRSSQHPLHWELRDLTAGHQGSPNVH